MLKNSRRMHKPETSRYSRPFEACVGASQLSTSTALTVTSKYKAAAAAAALALSVGVFGAAVPGPAPSASGAPLGASSVSTTGPGAVASSPTFAGSASPPSFGRFATDLVRSDALSTDVQKRPSVRPIINWLRKNAPKYYNKLKAAVKKGYGAFKKWYYDLPRPIRATINFLWSGTLYGLFEALLRYFF